MVKIYHYEKREYFRFELVMFVFFILKVHVNPYPDFDYITTPNSNPILKLESRPDIESIGERIINTIKEFF